MANYAKSRHDLGDLGENMNNSYDNFVFPYEDPAIINPDELASFPKTAGPSNSGSSYYHNHHHHHESHLVNKRTPVRDGKNITITDNHPD